MYGQKNIKLDTTKLETTTDRMDVPIFLMKLR